MDFFKQFLEFLRMERRCSEHTVISYARDIKSFLHFNEINYSKELKEITHQNIRGWIVELISRGNSKRTVNRKLSSLRTFFKWAQQYQYVKNNPCGKIKGLQQEKRIPEFVKEKELTISKMDDAFPDTFSGRRDRLLIEVLYQTGIRLSELINLEKRNVTNENIKVLGKRNKERYIPIPPILYQQFVKYFQTEEYLRSKTDFVFITDKKEKMYPKFVYRKVKYYLSLFTNLEKRSPHILRHTFATHMLNNGAGLETLKEILGHANLNATQIYTHNSFEEISKIYSKSHPRGEKK